MAEDIEEILAEIDESTMEEYQKFFNLFDKDKKGYIMAIQVGQVMDAMEQEYDDKMMRKTIKKSPTPISPLTVHLWTIPGSTQMAPGSWSSKSSLRWCTRWPTLWTRRLWRRS